ncbi:hypothetical protein ACLKA6_011627 [Drosophila palustris]
MSKLLSCALNHWTRQDLTRIDCDSVSVLLYPDFSRPFAPFTLGLLQLVNNYQRQSKLDWSLQESQQQQ